MITEIQDQDQNIESQNGQQIQDFDNLKQIVIQLNQRVVILEEEKLKYIKKGEFQQDLLLLKRKIWTDQDFLSNEFKEKIKLSLEMGRWEKNITEKVDQMLTLLNANSSQNKFQVENLGIEINLLKKQIKGFDYKEIQNMKTQYQKNEVQIQEQNLEIQELHRQFSQITLDLEQMREKFLEKMSFKEKFNQYQKKVDDRMENSEIDFLQKLQKLNENHSNLVSKLVSIESTLEIRQKQLENSNNDIFDRIIVLSKTQKISLEKIEKQLQIYGQDVKDYTVQKIITLQKFYEENKKVLIKLIFQLLNVIMKLARDIDGCFSDSDWGATAQIPKDQFKKNLGFFRKEFLHQNQSQGGVGNLAQYINLATNRTQLDESSLDQKEDIKNGFNFNSLHNTQNNLLHIQGQNQQIGSVQQQPYSSRLTNKYQTTRGNSFKIQKQRIQNLNFGNNYKTTTLSRKFMSNNNSPLPLNQQESKNSKKQINKTQDFTYNNKMNLSEIEIKDDFTPNLDEKPSTANNFNKNQQNYINLNSQENQKSNNHEQTENNLNQNQNQNNLPITEKDKKLLLNNQNHINYNNHSQDVKSTSREKIPAFISQNKNKLDLQEKQNLQKIIKQFKKSLYQIKTEINDILKNQEILTDNLNVINQNKNQASSEFDDLTLQHQVLNQSQIN